MKSPLCRCGEGGRCKGGQQCPCAGGTCKRAARLPAVSAADGRIHKAAVYRPQFAIGILCRDEADQRALFGDLSKRLAGRELKVLVI